MSDSLGLHRLVRQAPLSMGFSRQEYWSGLPSSSRGSSQQGSNPRPLHLLYWQVGSLLLAPSKKPIYLHAYMNIWFLWNKLSSKAGFCHEVTWLIPGSLSFDLRPIRKATANKAELKPSLCTVYQLCAHKQRRSSQHSTAEPTPGNLPVSHLGMDGRRRK